MEIVSSIIEVTNMVKYDFEVKGFVFLVFFCYIKLFETVIFNSVGTEAFRTLSLDFRKM